MYLIMNNRGQYLKTTLDKISFVNNKTMADSFNSKRESTDYIVKHFPKRKRKQYHVAFVSDLVEPLSNKESIISQTDLNNNISVDNTISTPKIDYIKKLQDIVDTYLVPEMEKYKSEVKKYDDMILDIRHYIRDDSTKANASWGYKIFKTLQIVERQRADCKKEFQRINTLKYNIQKSLTDFNNFEYEPYNNREIKNVVEFINNITDYK